MSNLPRTYLYLTIAVTLILTISLSASAQDSNKGSGGNAGTSAKTYKEFGDIQQRCHTRTVQRLPVTIKENCLVFVSSKRCRGYCKSLTNFQLEPPYLTRECACCKPHGEVTYKVKELECHGATGQKTGEKVMVAVPHDMNCQCVKCNRIING